MRVGKVGLPVSANTLLDSLFRDVPLQRNGEI
jgi:hypothetical protein